MEGVLPAGHGLRHTAAAGPRCESDKLPEPIFTPSTKAQSGHDDETYSFERVAELLGEATPAGCATLTLAIYGRAAD